MWVYNEQTNYDFAHNEVPFIFFFQFQIFYVIGHTSQQTFQFLYGCLVVKLWGWGWESSSLIKRGIKLLFCYGCSFSNEMTLLEKIILLIYLIYRTTTQAKLSGRIFIHLGFPLQGSCHWTAQKTCTHCRSCRNRCLRASAEQVMSSREKAVCNHLQGSHELWPVKSRVKDSEKIVA